jgi:cobalt transporter subunit CbtA
MIFRSIIISALLAGLLAGILLSVLQLAGVSPIIFAAEEFEQSEVSALPSSVAGRTVFEVEDLKVVPSETAITSGHDHSRHEHGHSAIVPPTPQAISAEELVTATPEVGGEADDHAGHSHDAEAWTPADGGERTFYTFASNILAGIGFAAVLLALMVQTHTQGLTRVTPLKGLAWGGAGFIALFVVPAIGLPPEIPGMEAAAIENRQGWWLLAVSAAVAGLACLAFAPRKMKALGVVVIAVPYLIGAPHPEGAVITHADAEVVTVLTQLHADFVMASALANLVFWLVLGLLSAYLLSRKLLAQDLSEAHA